MAIHSVGPAVQPYLNATNLVAPAWTKDPGRTVVPGTSNLDALTDTNTAPAKFYQVGLGTPFQWIPLLTTNSSTMPFYFTDLVIGQEKKYYRVDEH